MLVDAICQLSSENIKSSKVGNMSQSVFANVTITFPKFQCL